jgi:parvulin-like peptidyl-prolyl isomerase
MIRTVNNKGVKATVRNTKFKLFLVAILATFLIFLTGCPDPATKGAGEPKQGANGVDPNETAATVNGTAIKLEEVERAIKQQAQGQETKLSQLELTQARLQVLEGLIQQEVLFQKASKEQTIPTDEEITTELRKMKTSSGVSQEEFAKRMKDAGITEEILKEQLKKQLAINKLVEKVTGAVDSPSDKEIEDFYKGNKDAFVKKRGVKLAAIVVDPTDSGQGDTTTDEASTKLRVEEIFKKIQGGSDFAALATEYSEDPSRLRKGDLGYISEEQMKQSFSPQIAAAFMGEEFKVGGVTPAIPLQGKFYIFKLQDKVEKDEELTLESPDVRQQIIDNLVNTRKQLLQASYAAIALDEAEIVNYLAQKVVKNPNELSGARPAPTGDEDKKEDKAETDSKEDANAKSDEKSDEKKVDEKAEDKKADSSDGAKADEKKEEEKK